MTLTRDQFERWLRSGDVAIHMRVAYVIEPCDCRDVACKGWRLVPTLPRVEPARRPS